MQLAISDAHQGLKAAIAQGAFVPVAALHRPLPRDCLGHARKDEHGVLAALIRPDLQRRLARAGKGATRPTRSRTSTASCRRSRGCSRTPKPDILAFYELPQEHWRKLRSTNPLERLNREIGRRTDVVGIFPDDQSLLRLAGMLCIEQNDEWLVGRRYLSARAMTAARAAAPSRRRCSNSKRPEKPTALTTNVNANSYTTSRDLTMGRHAGASHMPSTHERDRLAQLATIDAHHDQDSI